MSYCAATMFTAPNRRALLWKWLRRSTTARLCGKKPTTLTPTRKIPRVSAAWMGMSISGDVTAPVIMRIVETPKITSCSARTESMYSGKIVLVRYSNPYSYRGFKALTAQREGAAAMLVYSDPAEDGYKKGTSFPKDHGGRRATFSAAPSPTTSSFRAIPLRQVGPAVPGAKRIPVRQAVSLPKIMALPLSPGKTQSRCLKTWAAPSRRDWQGGLPFEYHLGGEQPVSISTSRWTTP